MNRQAQELPDSVAYEVWEQWLNSKGRIQSSEFERGYAHSYLYTFEAAADVLVDHDSHHFQEKVVNPTLSTVQSSGSSTGASPMFSPTLPASEKADGLTGFLLHASLARISPFRNSPPSPKAGMSKIRSYRYVEHQNTRGRAGIIDSLRVYSLLLARTWAYKDTRALAESAAQIRLIPTIGQLDPLQSGRP